MVDHYVPVPMTGHQVQPAAYYPAPSPYGTQLQGVVQQPGQMPYYAAPPQVIVMQQPQQASELGPITLRLILAGGAGAGAVAALVLLGPMLISMLQTLAITGLVIAVVAVMVLRSFNEYRSGREAGQATKAQAGAALAQGRARTPRA
ncbi:DUF6251 family protein [Kitasatospora sp. NPDC059811]|uniref:DUF6251 family protein n=1 Tax=Streptomycetaceae TaxID=2062 RepID=UPI0007AFC234|nr:DUF6251 family protein [Streptomyces sp. MJM8645]